MENTGSKTLKSRNSHSNFRHGLNDYNDGENVTHQLGNDDYSDGANIPEYQNENAESFDGKTAGGNDFLEEEENESTGERSFDEGIEYE